MRVSFQLRKADLWEKFSHIKLNLRRSFSFSCAHINSSLHANSRSKRKKLKTISQRKAETKGRKKTWRNYNEKQFGWKREKWRMEDAFGEGSKKKALLLHYDKHENNFPPIFSIKRIAFFISCCFFSLPSLGKASSLAIDAKAAAAVVVIGVLEIEIAFYSSASSKASRLSRVDEMEMKTFMNNGTTLEISAF